MSNTSESKYQYPEFIIRQLIKLIQHIKVNEGMIRDSNLDEQNILYINYNKVNDILNETIYKFNLSHETKTKINNFIVENKVQYVRNMKNLKVINFDDFFDFMKEILIGIWNEQYKYYVTIYDSMTFGVTRLGITYFELILVVQYAFNHKISMDKVDKLFKKFKNNDALINYKNFEKIIVDNELFDKEYFIEFFLKVNLDEIHNILSILSQEINTSSCFSILDHIQSKISLTQKEQSYRDIKQKLNILTELLERLKNKIMKYQDRTGN